jgi:hypothetical protein
MSVRAAGHAVSVLCVLEFLASRRAKDPMKPISEVCMRTIVRILVLLGVAVILPGAAWAQVTLAGTVKDPSGGVLPGVTVEALSPVLIEKVRAATTDAAGQYRIESLQPGTYTVTFALAGFSTLKRENVVMSGTGVVKIDAEMKVGGVAETVKVAEHIKGTAFSRPVYVVVSTRSSRPL